MGRLAHSFWKRMVREISLLFPTQLLEESCKLAACPAWRLSREHTERDLACPDLPVSMALDPSLLKNTDLALGTCTLSAECGVGSAGHRQRTPGLSLCP